MRKCFSKEEAFLIAESHMNFHNKLFPNDIYWLDVQYLGREIWIRDRFNAIIEILQW